MWSWWARILKARGERPAFEEASGIRLALVAASDRTVQLEPARDQRLERRPRKAGVSPPSRAANETTRPQYATHLGQRAHRLAQVLQELVRMHDVERSVWKLQRVDVADMQLDRQPCPLAWAFACASTSGAVDANHAAWRDLTREIHGDRARPAAHVEQVEPRSKGRQEIARRVLGGSPGVAAEHRLMMTVRIDFVRHRRWDSIDVTPASKARATTMEVANRILFIRFTSV